MTDLPKPPQTYEEFTGRFPKLAEAWEAIGEAGKEGPLDQKTTRLVKLGVAIGAFREGPVHSSVRKA
ncbi:MAG: carboxymuconolactone decarboxylase family protein, partial [Gemmatimonadetes bacterium]|nr:carboxymuconolactone decarboxylase family protein [Gemmatimonadota bacterium]